MAKNPTLFALALAVSLVPACKDSTGPSITFPVLPAQLIANFCIRGDREPGGGISGTLAASDCPFGDGSFYEVYRIRVSENGQYRFAASSTFDNLLGVLRMDAHDDSSATLTLLDDDDDSGGNGNALINSVTLATNIDYLLVVNGFDSTDTGPYTVTFTKP